MSDMTREEAIKHLEDMKKGLFLWDMTELIDLCISALSTDGEYIKKEDALKAVSDMAYENSATIRELLTELPTYSFPDSAEDKGDLISRQAVDRLVWQYLRRGTDENIAFYEHFLDLPSADVRENIHGHWIEQIDHEENCRTLICSNCDRPALHDEDIIWKHKFCPHCGADMREPKGEKGTI